MRRLITIILLLLWLTAIGTVGFRIVSGASWIDCLYFTVITLTTVGYRENIPLDDTGKLFVVCFLVVCLGIFTYSAFQLGQWVFNAQLFAMREKRRMQKSIRDLSDHYIVCGCGRMGQTICRFLQERRRPFVVVDVNEEQLAQMGSEQGWLYLVGDATDDGVLRAAGVERARSLASVLPTDADNVYVVLSARLLASHLQIIARASDDKAVEKMERAGASRVVSPFSSGAVKMARFMLTPSIEDFLEIADAHGNELELADVQIHEGSPYVGRQLSDTDLRERGVMVIGIRRAGGERLMPPPGSAVLHVGDSLFAFGSTSAVNSMIAEADEIR